MAPRKGKKEQQEQVVLGPQVKEGENVFGVAHIFASFNDTFVHVTDLSGKYVFSSVNIQTDYPSFGCRYSNAEFANIDGPDRQNVIMSGILASFGGPVVRRLLQCFNDQLGARRVKTNKT